MRVQYFGALCMTWGALACTPSSEAGAETSDRSAGSVPERSWFGNSSDEPGLEPQPEPIPTVRQALSEEAEACRSAIISAQESPALPGAPRLEENRARVLARAKAEPVLFVEEPEYTGEVSKTIAARRKAMLRTKYLRDVMLETLSTFAYSKKRMRELLLRNGYLYTDDARAAHVLSTRLTLEKLFSEDTVHLQRGSVQYRLVRGKNDHYHYTSGPEQGQRARILLFDRVWAEGEFLGPALHVDVRELSREHGFEGMRPVHLGQDQMVAEVRFGKVWVPALFAREGVKLSLECLLVEPDDVNRVGRERDEAYRRNLVVHALQTAVTTQVRLGLPFDEPKTERGQQDGELRDRFEKAYFAGKSSYTFNGDTYPVFSEAGHPLTPQVCIDFVTETLERASGMHFAERGLKPEKIQGALDFDQLLQGGRRREMALRAFAKERPQIMQMIDFPQDQWVRYEKIDEFFSFVEKNKDNLRPGDIVIIRGRARWDYYKEVHSHTFFIYEADPITRMPTLLAGNAGKPRLVTWDSEMIRAPRRSIRHRIRPNLEWLHDHTVLRSPEDGQRWAGPLSLAER